MRYLILSTGYALGVSLYNYYLKRMSENLIEAKIVGVLYREGLQYYLLSSGEDKYALRAIDIYNSGIDRSHIGESFRAVVINDPSVIVPEGYISYCLIRNEAHPQ